MFDHLEYSVGSIDAARRFYGPICAAIGGGEVFFETEGACAGFGVGEVVHLLLTEGAPLTPVVHLSFVAPGKAGVVAAHAGALAGGGVCNGPPGYRDDYGPGYYAAFMRDADGHNVEVLFREG